MTAAEKKASRKGYKAALTREINSARRLMAEDEVEEVKTKLGTLKDKFKRFERSHEEYHQLITEDEENESDASEAYFEAAEQSYIEALLSLKSWLKEIAKGEEKIKPAPEVKQDLSRSELLNVLNLPKLQLETFNGDPLRYHNFVAVFDEHVERATTDPKVKLTRLIQCTSGPAKDAIRSCSLIGGEEGYIEAREILRKRFGDDYIVTEKIIKNLKNGKSIRTPDELRHLADELVTAHASLNKMKKLQEIDTQAAIVEIIGRLQPYLRNRWKRRALEYKRDKGVYPDFKWFVSFMVREADEATDPVYGSSGGKPTPDRPQPRDSRDSKVKTSFSSATRSFHKYPPCVACGAEEAHRLFNCDVFRAMKPPERLSLVKRYKLCENCLLNNHVTADCRKTTLCSVPNCGQKHTKFIHVDRVDDSGDVNRNRVVSACNGLNGEIFLPIVKVVVNDRFNTSALLDTGSTSSFCTKSMVTALGVCGQSADYLLNTIGSRSQRKQSQMVNLTLKSDDGRNTLNLSNVYVVDSIPVLLPGSNLQSFPHLRNLPVHDIGPQVDILIGQDHSEALIPLQVRRGNVGEPFAVKTLMGWSVNGPASHDKVNKSVIANFITSSTSDDGLERIWEIESGRLTSKDSWSHEDRQVVKLWDESIRMVEGHYELPIPWKTDAHLPNNLAVAKRRLQSNYQSLVKRDLLEKYEDEIQKLFDKGYAELVPNLHSCSPGNIWYLPHHAVLNPKKPDKLRIVFDCAAQCQGKSLNNQCHQGPDLNNKLFDVLLRFRQHQFAVMGDIEAMYHQVKIPEYDRDALRFLWYDSDGALIHCRMTSHLFGGVWCAASSTYALRRLLCDYPNVDNIVADTVRNAFYVDDCLLSVTSEQDAVEAIHGTRELLAKAGFNLTKFTANQVDVLAEIPDKDRAKDIKDFSQGSCSKVLGIKWDLPSDVFSFDVSISVGDVTKRIMLSVVSSVFDPLGFVSPILVTGRLLFQEAVRLKLSWDESVPPDLSSRWCSWLSALPHLSDFKITRCIKPPKFDEGMLQLHHFCDASLQSYGFCSYVRVINKSGEVLVSLLLSKCRVAPLKLVRIPRLELEAALLAARADGSIRQTLSITIDQSFFWTDSAIVLNYIQNDSLRFHVYVGNRVSEIRHLSNPSQWSHVPGTDNPADLLTRGEDPQRFDLDKWLHGPEFLSCYMSDWSFDSPNVQHDHDDPELKHTKIQRVVSGLAEASVHPIDCLISHYSSWYRLKRALAWWLKLKDMLRPKHKLTKEKLSVKEINQAEIMIVKHVQVQCFPKELQSLSKGEVRRSGRLRNLSPFLDDEGVLCVGGRLVHAGVTLRRKHPCVIPHDHPIASLIVDEFHRPAHLGTEWTLSLLQSKYWITRARSVINKVRQKCVTCKKLFAKPADQRMADLPPERLQGNNPPFTYVGLDCFGPFFVKQGRSEVKRYGCLFTCLGTRAVHIEMLRLMDTDSFLNAFRRFVARRGCPLKVWSDNGTNFVGARTELSKSRKEIVAHSVKHDIEWNFIPPGAPHMGGVWERVVRTIKRVMSAILNNVRLTDETLHTLFCEIESIVNSRPITKVSNDVHDHPPLTPNHLLLLRHGPSPPPGIFTETDVYRRRWRHVQHLANQFWRRWLREYLPQLQTRRKWHDPKSNLQVDDVVLVMNENVPRGLWPLGIVVDVIVGKDGLVRTVKVKTNSTVLTRPITKLVPLECNVMA